MFADKYPSIFSRQMEAIVYLKLLLELSYMEYECFKCCLAKIGSLGNHDGYGNRNVSEQKI